MSDQLMVSLYMVMSQNVMYHLGEGDFTNFYEIPISTIKLPDFFKFFMHYADTAPSRMHPFAIFKVNERRHSPYAIIEPDNCESMPPRQDF